MALQSLKLHLSLLIKKEGPGFWRGPWKTQAWLLTDHAEIKKSLQINPNHLFFGVVYFFLEVNGELKGKLH